MNSFGSGEPPLNVRWVSDLSQLSPQWVSDGCQMGVIMCIDRCQMGIQCVSGRGQVKPPTTDNVGWNGRVLTNLYTVILVSWMNTSELDERER